MLISQARLKELLVYDPLTGIFTWRVNRYRVTAGSIAGSLSDRGYITIGICGAKRVKAHRLAWLYMVGEIPSGIDHKNGNRTDNRWANLRAATQSQNMANSSWKRTHPYKGIRKQAWNGRWQARITKEGVRYCLGTFDTQEEAAAAYDAAAKNLFGEFSRTNF